MSKSLRAQIEADICQRELERKRKEKERTEKQRSICESAIFQAFTMELEKCLSELTNYQGHQVNVSETYDFLKYADTAVHLGFSVVERKERSYDNVYFLNVPPIQKGIKRTPAQKKLIEFNHKLNEARKKRKDELLEVCKNVKADIQAGSYDYHITNIGKQISVPHEVEIVNAFECEVVQRFFKKYGLYFITPEQHIEKRNENAWRFDLK